jgi:hypothetical protein
VESVQAGQTAVPQDQPYVRVIPVPPSKDWSPSQVVQGYLRAAGSFYDGQRTARLYLNSGVQWTGGGSVYVTSGQAMVGGAVKAPDGTVEVTVTGAQAGQIDAGGQYQAAQGNISETFHLKNTSKGWRISQLPADLTTAILLSKDDVNRAFAIRNLYFLAPGGDVLVPNPVYLPYTTASDLPAQIVRAQIKGPSNWLTGAVNQAFPSGTYLLGNKVEVSADETATVNLSSAASTGNITQMSAQLALAFRASVPQIKRLKLEINGVPRGGGAQPLANWLSFDPDWSMRAYMPYSHGAMGAPAYVRDADGHLATLNIGGSAVRVPSLADYQVTSPAISLDRTRAAWLSPNRHILYVGSLSQAGQTRQILTAPSDSTFTRPTWDRSGNLWVVESSSSASSLWLAPGGQSPFMVPNWGLADHSVRAFRVATDGVRAAAIVVTNGHGTIDLGYISRVPKSNQPFVDSFIGISPLLVDVKDLSWMDSNDLVALAIQQSGDLQPEPYHVPVNGDVPNRMGSGLPSGLISIASAPYQAPLLAGTSLAGHQLCYLQEPQTDLSSQWACEAPGTDPVYPG